MDHDMDNKSHVSELTEDRTQRQFEAYQQQHQRDFTASYHLNPDAASPRIGSSPAARHHKRLSGPPSFIGVNKSAADADDLNDDVQADIDQEEEIGGVNDSFLSRNRELDTINSSNVSGRSFPSGTPPHPMRRNDIPRSGGRAANNASESDSSENDNKPKMSVAQRARLEADRQSTPVRARLDEKTQSALQKHQGSFSGETKRLLAQAQRQRDDRRSRSANSQSSHQSGLWKRMEEAVLGPRSDEEEEEEDDGSTSASEGTEENRRTRGRSAHGEVIEEKKSSDSPSVSLEIAQHMKITADSPPQSESSLTMSYSL
jgi:hypothetical protein